jgi:hypothetical protein
MSGEFMRRNSNSLAANQRRATADPRAFATKTHDSAFMTE